MTRRRWIADEVAGRRAALTGSHADHLIRVLRARMGQEFDVVAGEGVYRGTVVEVSEGRVEFELREQLPASSPARMTILLSIFKFDRMEWAIEKCTELGVTGFVPLIAARTDAHLGGSAGKRVERWRRIVREASEQARRASTPGIAEPVRLKEAVSLTAGLRILLSETETGLTLTNVFREQHSVTDLILAVGPEGGWTPAEETAFRNSGWTPASLGQTILRAETAAVAATAIAMSHL